MSRASESILIIFAGVVGVWSAVNTGAVAASAAQTGFDKWLYVGLGVLAFLQLVVAAVAAVRRNISSVAILVLASSPLGALEWANAKFAHSIRDFSGLIAVVTAIVVLLIVTWSQSWRIRRGNS